MSDTKATTATATPTTTTTTTTTSTSKKIQKAFFGICLGLLVITLVGGGLYNGLMVSDDLALHWGSYIVACLIMLIVTIVLGVFAFKKSSTTKAK